MATQGELALSPALAGRPAARLDFDAWSYGAERELSIDLGGHRLVNPGRARAEARLSGRAGGTGPGVLTLTVDPPAEPVAVRGLDSVYAVGLAVAEDTLTARALGDARRP